LLDGEGRDDADGLQGLGGLGEDPELSERRSQGGASSVYAVRGARGGRIGTVRGRRRPYGWCRGHGATAIALALVAMQVSADRRTQGAVRSGRAVGSEPIGRPTGHPHTYGLASR